MASKRDIEKALLSAAIEALRQVEASEKEHCLRANKLAEELAEAVDVIVQLHRGLELFTTKREPVMGEDGRIKWEPKKGSIEAAQSALIAALKFQAKDVASGK